MFNRPKKEQSKIKQEIDLLHDELAEWDKHSDEYEAIMKQLKVLYELDRDVHVRIDPNTALVVAANLIGIVAILKHEQLHVVTSKALSFVIKGRV